MNTLEEQNALVLEVVDVQLLIIPVYPNLPLLKLPHQSLFALLCDTRNVRFSSCVLKTQFVSGINPELLQRFEYGHRLL
jgi:hypothetical protein